MSEWLHRHATRESEGEASVRAGDATWHPRPLVALVLKTLVIVVPLVASVAVSVVVAGLMPVQASFAGQVLWWAAILASSGLVLIGGEVVARRVLPLVGLLRLSLLFPGKAPSRMGLARRSSRRELERMSDEIRARGLGSDAEAAAHKLVHLVAALDAHDRRTRGHSERVRTYTDLLAHRMHLDPDDANKLRWAALLHDIGKLAIPAEILNKPGRLTEHEWDLIHQHPAEGARMLGALGEWLGPWGSVVVEHHERWDGTGYPNGLAGNEISLGARLVSVTDSYDVMTSVRSYQPQPRTPGGAKAELVRCAGTQFDAGMVRRFLDISTRRLWWMLGPVAWLVQVPIVGRAAGAALRRPPRRAPNLAQGLVSGVAVLALAPGFPGSAPSQSPTAGAVVGAARGRAPDHGEASAVEDRGTPSPDAASTHTLTGSRTDASPGTSTEPGPPPGSGDTPSSDAAASSSSPSPTTTPPAPGGGTAAPRPVDPATTAPAPGTGPTTAPSRPGEPVAPPESGDGHGHGYGHVVGKGEGHAHHDADGDGVDDKAGSPKPPKPEKPEKPGKH